MSTAMHLQLLAQGVSHWNEWRRQNPGVHPELASAALSRKDLKGADLSRCSLASAHLNGSDLAGANLHRANLSAAILQGTSLVGSIASEAELGGANLRGADLTNADLCGAGLNSAYLNGAILEHANLTRANLRKASLFGTNLRHAILKGASLRWANLTRTDLTGADLEECDLTGASLIDAQLAQVNLTGADLRYSHIVDTSLAKATVSGCRVYGVAAWNLDLEGARQSDLLINRPDEPTISVDDLEIAQFVYLLLNNEKVRRAIDTITSKVVLILGRFAPERKVVLDALREELRKRGYSPVLFDFEKPASRDLTETVSTLAHMARFVIADITDARSIPQELMAIVPNLPSVPVQPLLLATQHEYGMFEHFRRYPWVLPEYVYEDLPSLLAVLPEKVIGPAEAKAREQTGRDLGGTQ